ncbi:hypothetical protein D3C81_1856500 [compost metagenome]
MLAPFKNLFQLFPVIHVLKFHLLYRSAGHDQSVKAAVADLIKGFIKALQVFGGSILGSMGAGVQQNNIHLKR